MTTADIDEVMRSLDNCPPAPTEVYLDIGSASKSWYDKQVEIELARLRKDKETAFRTIGAIIDMTPDKEVYALLKLEYYRNYLSLRKKH